MIFITVDSDGVVEDKQSKMIPSIDLKTVRTVAVFMFSVSAIFFIKFSCVIFKQYITSFNGHLWYLFCHMHSFAGCFLYGNNEKSTANGYFYFFCHISTHLLWAVYIFGKKPHVYGQCRERLLLL